MKDFGAVLGQWIQQNKIEAVISNWTIVLNALEMSAAVLPEDPIVIEIGVAPGQSVFGGTTQRDMVVGERAMEQLAMLLKTHQTGCIETPNRILVPGVWLDGTRPLGEKKEFDPSSLRLQESRRSHRGFPRCQRVHSRSSDTSGNK